MSNRTDKYRLGYFEEGDLTSSVLEMQRFETLDAQLRALFEVIGNGVIDGWDILASSGLSIVVKPGSGHVAFVSVESTVDVVLSGLTPSTTNHIYARLNSSSFFEKDVSFVSFLTKQTEDDATDLLFLGSVTTSATAITTIDVTDRKILSFLALVQELVSEHRHIGGTNNPAPVDLGSEVQGIINQDSLPDLDASIIKTGTIDDDRLPTIDHVTKLINQGTLTHAQLDSFVETLNIEDPTLMGETSTINLLQLILALKHVYPDIDEFLVNEIAFIPGISPDSLIDTDNTTATVDTRAFIDGGTHTITGAAAPAKKLFTRTWDTEPEFKEGTQSDVIVDGDTVCLETEENTQLVEGFGDIDSWTVITDDLSSVPSELSLDSSDFVTSPSSGKLVLGTADAEIALVIQRDFDAQDWSEFNSVVFFLDTEDIEHGDVFFFINDVFAGSQNSFIKVLDRNTPTVNIDTLQNGFQEIVVDITSFTRTNINQIGFLISTQSGWDTSKGFDLNIDNVFLTSGNKFKDEGFIRVIFDTESIPREFSKVRREAQIPSDSQSTGVGLKGRTRVGNTLADLSVAVWSAFSSDASFDINLPAGVLFKFIEIEFFFDASDDQTRSACLTKIFLDFFSSDVDGSFNFNDQDAWESGSGFNLDTTTVIDSILIDKTEEVNDIFYGTNKNAVQLNDTLKELFRITGSVIPISTNQVLNGITPSFSLLTGVARGDSGNIWVTDTDNDRILEIDKSGTLVRGFFGSFLVPPTDPYGIEEAGPGSNKPEENADLVTPIVSIDSITVSGSSVTVNLDTSGVFDHAHVQLDDALELTGNAGGSEVASGSSSFTFSNVLNGTHRVFAALVDENHEIISNQAIGTFSIPDGEQVGVVHSVYNASTGILYIVFDHDLETVHNNDTKLDLTKIFLKVGSQRFSLLDSTSFLVGIDGDKYDDWFPLTTSTDVSAQFINQFTFSSHVLGIGLNGADKILLNQLVNDLPPSVVILDPHEMEKTSTDVTVKFLIYNFDLGTMAGENGIRVTLDSSSVQNIFSDTVTFTGLSTGTHTVRAQLLNADGSLNTNIEADATGSFTVFTSSSTAPYISVTSPKPNQIFSSNPVTIEFEVENFSVLSAGQHIRYKVDGGVEVDYFSTDPIVLDDLTAGAHSIKLFFVDEVGTSLGFEFGTVTANFIVGLNSNARVRLFVDEGAIRDESKTLVAATSREDVAASNVVFTNTFSPIDIQVIAAETSSVNRNGLPTEMVAKLRSETWTTGLSDSIHKNEFVSRLQTTPTSDSPSVSIGTVSINGSDVTFIIIASGDFSHFHYKLDSAITTSAGISDGVEVLSGLTATAVDIANGNHTIFVALVDSSDAIVSNQASFNFSVPDGAVIDLSSIPTAELIFGTKFLNGHSAVQLSLQGKTIMSNNAAKFALSKSNAKLILGSVEKLGNNEILVGDSINKRALITFTDLETEKPLIEWEYNSDRFVSDFHIILQDDVVIELRDDSISDANVFVKQGTTVIWENTTASPVSVNSGTTTFDQFQLDPDLTLFGDIFRSPVLEPGERFAFKFAEVGEVNWFVYPSILTGKITVTRNRISSTDQFIILENDGLESPFSSRVIKVDSWGNVVYSFGESFLVQPRDARPLLNGGILIST